MDHLTFKNLACGLGVIALAFIPSTGEAQGTLFVEGNNVGIGVATPTTSLHVQKSDGTAKIRVEETSGTTSVRELFQLVNNGGPFFIFADTSLGKSWAFASLGNNDFTINQQQNAGIEYRFSPTGNLTIAGTLTQGSSREIKTSIEPVDSIQILNRVVDLPISEWSYTSDAGVRHLGPMAEDFRHAFGLGADPRGISSIDTSGVALAAIQGLYEELQSREADLERVRTENESLSANQALLETRLRRLERLITSEAE